MLSNASMMGGSPMTMMTGNPSMMNNLACGPQGGNGVGVGSAAMMPSQSQTMPGGPMLSNASMMGGSPMTMMTGNPSMMNNLARGPQGGNGMGVGSEAMMPSQSQMMPGGPMLSNASMMGGSP